MSYYGNELVYHQQYCKVNVHTLKNLDIFFNGFIVFFESASSDVR